MDTAADTFELELEPALDPKDVRLVRARVAAVNADAAVLHFTRDGVQVNGTMPITEYLPGHSWAVGDVLTVLVCDSSPAPLVSMVRPEILPALLAGVSAEVRNGQVRVMGMARRPGVRTKLAVATTDPDVDPIAACVGRTHNRVDHVKSALLGEQVDIIAWHPDQEIFLRNALQPASVSDISIDAEAKTATAVAPGHQMSAAVGGGGLNSALAGQLVGLMVRIVPQA